MGWKPRGAGVLPALLCIGLFLGCAADNGGETAQSLGSLQGSEGLRQQGALQSPEGSQDPEELRGQEVLKESEGLKQEEKTGQPGEGSIPGMAGIGRASWAYAAMDDWGVKLTARDISCTGLTLVCEQQGGEPTGDLETGSYYSLETFSDGQWAEVENLRKETELAWTCEAWRIAPEAETDWEMDWEWLYGKLPAGFYRIGKEVMDFRGAGDFDKRMYYACFELVETDVGYTVSSCSLDGGAVSLDYVDGWEYQVFRQEEVASEDYYGMDYGICFRPIGENGWVRLGHYDNFAVCGTGLEKEKITLANGLVGSQGTYIDAPGYKNGQAWDFIIFQEPYSEFVAITEGVDEWWPRYGGGAMGILGTAVLSGAGR